MLSASGKDSAGSRPRLTAWARDADLAKHGSEQLSILSEVEAPKTQPSALGPREKDLGSFYTPPEIARVLAEWALTDSTQSCLDPSFGGGVFLSAARRRLLELGCQDDDLHLYGVDLDPSAHGEPWTAWPTLGRKPTLLEADFFAVEPEKHLPRIEAVVGNPPYVRYQGWDGRRGRKIAAASAVKLTRLASSWAPFVVHATNFLRARGRMALVLPAELLHAQYAEPVRDFLVREFGDIRLITFQERVFPGALEEVVLLLAEDYGGGPADGISLVEATDLARLPAALQEAPVTRPAIGSKRASRGGSGNLLVQLLSKKARSLLAELEGSPQVCRLGDVASVDIGAVTGANKFFLLTEAEKDDLPNGLTREAISRAAHIQGAVLARRDLERLGAAGKRLNLLVASADSQGVASEEFKRLIARGEAEGLQNRYKCRVREPWWAVPLPRHDAPDLFLTYFSSSHPRVVVNRAGALHTNTIHGLSLRDPKRMGGEALASCFSNSLTWLSAELAGRSYGGGVLKLEPSEAEAVLLPVPGAQAEIDLEAVDSLTRARDLEGARGLVDDAVLKRGLGLSDQDVELLMDAGSILEARRRQRSQKRGAST